MSVIIFEDEFSIFKKLYFCQHQPHKTKKETKSSLSFPPTRHPRVHDPMRSQHDTNQSYPYNLEMNRVSTHSWEGEQFVVSFAVCFSSPLQKTHSAHSNRTSMTIFWVFNHQYIANQSLEGGKKGRKSRKGPNVSIKENFFSHRSLHASTQKHLHSLTPLAVKITLPLPSFHSSQAAGEIRQTNNLCWRRIFSGCDLPKKQLLLLEVKEESQPISDKQWGGGMLASAEREGACRQSDIQSDPDEQIFFWSQELSFFPWNKTQESSLPLTMWELLKNDRCDDVRWVIQAIVVFDPSHENKQKTKKQQTKKAKAKATHKPLLPQSLKKRAEVVRERRLVFSLSSWRSAVPRSTANF